MLASEVPSCFPALEARGVSGDGDEEAWDMIGYVTAVAQQRSSVCAPSSMAGQTGKHVRVIDMTSEAMPVKASLNMQKGYFARKSERRLED
jgi:hypothetical protein